MISQKSNKIADACRFCWMCRHVCPVGLATGREEFTPHARGLMVSMMKRGCPMDASFAEAMYACALCGACSNDCATGYEPPVFIREARREAAALDLLPEKVGRVVGRALEGGDVATPRDTEARRALFEALSALPDKAGTLLYVGETAMNRAPQSALALLSLLKKAGVPFAAVRDEKLKMGGALYDLIGDTDEVRRAAEAFAAAVRASGAATIVALDPTDARTLKIQYPEWGIDTGAQAVTATRFVADLIQAGRLSPKKLALSGVTFHDPCRLARDLDETQPARDILLSMGVSPREMFLHGRMTRCCGNETLAAYAPEIAGAMAAERIADAGRADAQIVVTACPGCFDVLSGAAGDVKIMDIFELLDSAC